MELSSLRFSIKLPVEPARLYAAWLDSKQHAAFTGGPAKIDPHVGGAHSAWSDYIQGKTLELEPGRRIVQSWHASEFHPDAADSTIELTFEPNGKAGTLLTLVHTEIPSDLKPLYETGWAEYYFKPMRKYFQLLKDKEMARKTAMKKAAKKAAPKKAAPKKAAPKKAAPKKAC